MRRAAALRTPRKKILRPSGSASEKNRITVAIRKITKQSKPDKYENAPGSEVPILSGPGLRGDACTNVSRGWLDKFELRKDESIDLVVTTCARLSAWSLTERSCNRVSRNRPSSVAAVASVKLAIPYVRSLCFPCLRRAGGNIVCHIVEDG